MLAEPARFANLSNEELALICAKRPVDQQAWDVFYNRLHKYVWNQVCFRLKVDRSETADIVQEVFVRLFSGLRSYNPEKSSIQTYAAQITRNLVIDRIRRGSQPLALATDLALLRLRAAKDPEIYKIVAECIVDGLGSGAEIIIAKEFIRGCDVEDICAKHGFSKSKVYATRTWMRELLREIRI